MKPKICLVSRLLLLIIFGLSISSFGNGSPFTINEKIHKAQQLAQTDLEIDSRKLIDRNLIINNGRLPPRPIPQEAFQAVFPNVRHFQIIKYVPGYIGTYPAMVPFPSDDECLPVPREIGETEDRWGIAYSVSANTRPLRRIRICRINETSRNCFYDRAVSANNAEEGFITVPDEAQPDPRADSLPRLIYRLEVEVEGSDSVFTQNLTRKLAPLPQVAISGRVQVTGPSPVNNEVGGYQTRAKAKFSSTRYLRLLTVVGELLNDNDGILLIENRDLMDRSMPLIPVSPKREEQSTYICEMRNLSRDAADFWRDANYPVRIWAQAPLIEGCSLTTVNDVPAQASFWGWSPSSPTCHNRDPELKDGRIGGVIRLRPPMRPPIGMPEPEGTCVGGRPCEVIPNECKGGLLELKLNGITQCVGGREVCIPSEPYCPGSSSFGCGDILGSPCEEGSCVPGLQCVTQAGIPGSPARCEAINPGVCHNYVQCWKPMKADGSWPDRPPDDINCFGERVFPCTPQCNGSNCGNDGCGGSCGNCSDSQTCVTSIHRANGGICLPASCETDADCCTSDDEDCTDLGRYRCDSGSCRSTF